MEKPVIFGPGDILSDPDGSTSHIPVAQHFDGCGGLGGDLKGAMSHTSGVPFLGDAAIRRKIWGMAMFLEYPAW
jgi:hypothetical protein